MNTVSNGAHSIERHGRNTKETDTYMKATLAGM
jgi:hypothetical protein